jgi:hypothetical protein|tara:strand:- start:2785 stop:2907 length:123 start_codon:yes stop_codon:yes gene_type:complete
MATLQKFRDEFFSYKKPQGGAICKANASHQSIRKTTLLRQ